MPYSTIHGPDNAPLPSNNETVMTIVIRSFFIALAAVLIVTSGARAEAAKPHRLIVQVDQNDPDVMNLALNNTRATFEYYKGKNEDVTIEVVAYGPGLHMLRDDTSPVKDRIKELTETHGSKLVFSACNNTKQGMEKREGHAISIIPQARLVPAGVVRIMELQEEGFSYVKP